MPTAISATSDKPLPSALLPAAVASSSTSHDRIVRRSYKDSEFAVMQEETVHGRHGLCVFVKATHDVASRRDTHQEGVAER